MSRARMESIIGFLVYISRKYRDISPLSEGSSFNSGHMDTI